MGGSSGNNIGRRASSFRDIPVNVIQENSNVNEEDDSSEEEKKSEPTA